MKRLDLNAISSAQTRQVQRTDVSRPNGTTLTTPVNGSAAKTGGDQVAVSSTGREVSQLVDRAKNLPDIRQERVDSLRQLIDSGKYEVSSKTIAAAMLRDEQ
ncbi:MAG TPA: flagellar biosynthesis anti-sigma factor FlgM [Pyrinomonadaceae bacterium]